MQEIRTIEQISELKSNTIIGIPTLDNTQVIFTGINNTLVCEEGVLLRNSVINFYGNNSLIYLCKSKHPIFINASTQQSSTIYLGRDNYINWTIKLLACEHKNIVIGKDCLFSYQIELRNCDPHIIYDIGTKQRINHAGSILIGDHVWVGMGSLLLKNSHVGSGSIIGGKSVVAGKNIPSNSSYAGNPVKKIRENVFFDGRTSQAFTEENTQNFNVSNTEAWIYHKDETSLSRTELDKHLAPQIDISQKIEFLRTLTRDDQKNRFVLKS